MRNFLIALVFLLAAIFFIGKLTEVQAIGETLQRGDLRFLFIALIIQLTWFLNVAISYQVIYRMLGLKEKTLNLLLASSAANFVNVVAPSVGVGGVAVFVSQARRNGNSPAKATLAGVLYLIFDYAGFLCVLAVGLLVLFRRNNLHSADLFATGYLFLIASGLTLLLILGMRSSKSLGRALSWIARQVNRLLWIFLHRPYLSEERAKKFAIEASDGLQTVRNNPRYILLPIALAVCSKTLLLSVFFLMFLAFQVPYTPGTLVAGFSIGYLFFIVSPTPSGIGIVEGALTLTLRSMYVPLGAAAVVTLTYRGFTFWIPFAIGGLTFRLLGYIQPQAALDVGND